MHPLMPPKTVQRHRSDTIRVLRDQWRYTLVIFSKVSYNSRYLNAIAY